MLVVATLFWQPKRQLHTWISIDGQYWNQIDYILCSQRWRSSIQSGKTKLGADSGSDHKPRITKFRLKLKKVGKTTRPFTTQSCLILCNLVDYRSPGSSVQGIVPERLLEWGAISSSRGSSRPRDRIRISCIGRRALYPSHPEKPMICGNLSQLKWGPNVDTGHTGSPRLTHLSISRSVWLCYWRLRSPKVSFTTGVMAEDQLRNSNRSLLVVPVMEVK